MRRKNKRMPVWLMILLDTVLMCAAVGIFLVFDYLTPKKGVSKDRVVAQTDAGAVSTFALPGQTAETDRADIAPEDEEPKETTTRHSTQKPRHGERDSESSQAQTTAVTTAPPEETTTKRTTANWYDNMGTDDYAVESGKVQAIFNAEVTSEEIGHYENESTYLTLYRKTIGEGSDRITYFIGDAYVTDVTVIKAALAENTYGKNIKEPVQKLSEDNNAILAVNGDYYGNSEEGVVIRNGVLYRDDINDCDVCMLYMDGTMATFTSEELDLERELEKGVWQCWCFGPMLLDGQGNVLDTFNTTTYLNSENPRTMIGYVSPGHYIIGVVDGREDGWSRGASISELAAIMADEGCLTAYNLDGGMSTMLFWDGVLTDHPDRGGRKASDIIYIGR